MTDPIDHLLSLPDGEAQRAWLTLYPTLAADGLATRLKARADHLMRTDVQACLRVVSLMNEVGQFTGNPRDLALARLAEANVRGIYLGEYDRALAAYDAAATIYARLGDTLGQAIAQIGRLWPLANLGRTAEAFEAGAWAAEVLAAHGEWSRLADLLINQGVLHGRLGEDRQALAHFDRARDVLLSNLEPHPQPLPSAGRGASLSSPPSLRGKGDGGLSQHPTPNPCPTKGGEERRGKGTSALPPPSLAGKGAGGLGQHPSPTPSSAKVGEARPGWMWPTLARADLNRSIVLRTLGNFAGALQASQSARQIYADLGQRLSVAKADESRALTLLLIGRTNEALTLLDTVRGVFEREGLTRHAVLVDLFVSDCYLLMQRWLDAKETTARTVSVFDGLGVHLEVGQALVNQALAQAQLGQIEAALAALAQARLRFRQEHSPVWLAVVDLVSADLVTGQGQYDLALAYAQAAVQTFDERGLATRAAQARLSVARSLLGLGRRREVEAEARAVLALAPDVPWVTYQAEVLLGQLASLDGDTIQAEQAYLRAVAAVERLRGALMVEFHADFMRDKDGPYAALTDLYLDLEQPEAALTIVERSRSRALVALLSDRLDIRIQARDAADADLVADLERLRAERNMVYRRWHDPERGRDDEPAQQRLFDLEKRMTEGWHRLLTRNADYAREASLWQGHIAPVQDVLPDDTLLLEYYTTAHGVMLFAVTHSDVKGVRLAVTPGEVDRWLRPLWLNLKTTRDQVVAGQAPTLTRHAQALLQRLYRQLMAPVADLVDAHPKLIIVPHGPLHYLPFHALHDGTVYLAQRHAISYLPASSLLRLLQSACKDGQAERSEASRPARRDSSPMAQSDKNGQADRSEASRLTPEETLRYAQSDRQYGFHPRNALVVGHSHGGRLPQAVVEARAIGVLIGGHTLIEDEATLAAIGALAENSRIVHIAAHGDFRADNPLFSGLRLADGQLTTLDLFNVRLHASLVTLSACQTGESVVGGGDELIGLTRALFYAGAASVLVSHWCVEDRATATLMQTFYRALLAGQTKAEALRRAQLACLADPMTEHPYFWAAFFLAGDGGAL